VTGEYVPNICAECDTILLDTTPVVCDECIAQAQAENERLRKALSQAGRTMCGMCEIEMCFSPCIGRQDILDALKEE
jgi:hypothetical protein